MFLRQYFGTGFVEIKDGGKVEEVPALEEELLCPLLIRIILPVPDDSGIPEGYDPLETLAIEVGLLLGLVLSWDTMGVTELEEAGTIGRILEFACNLCCNAAALTKSGKMGLCPTGDTLVAEVWTEFLVEVGIDATAVYGGGGVRRAAPTGKSGGW